MQTNLRTLGPSETRVVLSFTADGRTVVTARDVIAMLGAESSARKVIYNLIQKGWLSRLRAGRYMFLPPDRGPENLGENNILALASAVIEPSYVGWWAAAAFYGLTTQRPMTISVATLRQVKPRTIEGTDVRFVKLTKCKFFGFATEHLYGRDLVISTLAKTAVDCLDHLDLAGGPSEVARIVHGVSQEVSAAELVETALRMKSTALLQRLGFFTDLVARPLPSPLRQEVRAAIPRSSRSVLGDKHRQVEDIGYVADWGLLVNLNRRDLLSDVPSIQE
jgi:predicted transcriptional regulator of viral defense system